MTIINYWNKSAQKGYFQSEKEKKNENHRRILYIGIKLVSTFQLQQTILIF